MGKLTICCLLFISALSSPFSMQAAVSCEKCDLEKIETAREHMSELTFEIVEDFLCTFDSSCRSDLDFYRRSNETLFDLVYNAPDLFLTVLQFGTLKNHKVILEELKTPIHVGIDVEAVRNRVMKTDDTQMFKNDVLSALD